MRITLETSPAASEIEFIYRNLYADNRRQAPVLRGLRDDEFAVCLHNDRGQLQGGAICQFKWGWLFLDTLWVADSARGNGYGRLILQAAESYAASQGVIRAFCYTADFQAKEFYEKQGYVVSGTLRDRPPGHTVYYFQKTALEVVSSASGITIQNPPVAATRHTLEDGLLTHAAQYVPFQREHETAIFLRENATLRGGLTGYAAWNWFEIELFWIDKSARGSGYGTQMINRLKAFCRAQGLTGILTATADFQALPFYRKQGFYEFSTLADHPPGHTCYFVAHSLNADIV